MLFLQEQKKKGLIKIVISCGVMFSLKLLKDSNSTLILDANFPRTYNLCSQFTIININKFHQLLLDYMYTFLNYSNSGGNDKIVI
jgi:hypothetical protein